MERRRRAIGPSAIEARARRIREGWDAETERSRRQGDTKDPPVVPPRYRGFRPGGRAAAGSTAGLGYDQHDLFFEHMCYVLDHEDTP